ncbi:MAG: hypothetical protein JJU32_00015 [Phormidium sp. BM_Day4_Bin.17]|nr:hypothetical protein [Phormidium sp. BM_Day4_Bin.17]UCJ11379.1 MAG: hypothetical protein JWS08_16655 [Phormidium sp. PBR-2020]
MRQVSSQSIQVITLAIASSAILLNSCHNFSSAQEQSQESAIENRTLEEPGNSELAPGPQTGFNTLEVEEPLSASSHQSPEVNGSGEIAAVGETAEPAALFTEVLPQIRSTTEIPIRLPSYVPIHEDDQTPLYVEAEATEESYQIYLSLAPDCRGATACSYGFFAARRTTDEDYYGVGEEFQETVPLAEGITGDFNPMMCGASCSPPVIEWSQEGVRYRIALKGVGPEDENALESLQALANSAIANDP